MTKRTQTGLVCSLVLSLMVVYLTGCAGVVGSVSADAGVVSNPASLNFGSVAINTASSAVTVTLTNAGHQSLSILQASSSLSEFVLTGPSLPLTLASGQTTSFNVAFRPDSATSFSGSLNFALNRTSGGMKTIPVSGTGTSTTPPPSPSYLLSPSTTAMSFGNVTSGSSSTQSVKLNNTGNSSVSISQVNVSGAGFSASGIALPLTLAAGQSASLNVAFAPTATGTVTGKVAIVSNATNSPATVTLSGAGVQQLLPQLSVVPASASFGNVTVGTTNTQTVTLSNTGSANLNVSQVTVSGSGFGLSGLTLPLTVAPGKSAAFTVSFGPTAASNATGSVSILSNAPNSPTTIALSGSGVAASLQLTASPTSLSYGNVTVGSSGSKTVTLTNTGNSSVSISQLSVSGAGFTASGLTPPLGLTAGQSTTFSVKFAPTVAGSASGSVSVANSSNSPTQIALTGTGVQLSVTGVTITPTNPSVQAGQTIQFTGTVQGTTTNTSVTWTASAGSITPSGLFTAPSSAGTATVTATSSADPSKNASTTVTVTTPVSSSGPQFYVATTGNDANNGTSTSAPWRTIQKAMNSATPGSTVNIMAGTYHERLTMGVSGTSGNYITFQPLNFSVPGGGCGGYTGVACGGDQVILDYAYLGTVTDTAPFFLISSKNYIRVQGLTFQNFTCTGAFQQGLRIDNGSSFVEFNHNKFLNLRNVYPTRDGTAALLAIYVWGPAHDVTFNGNEMGTIWVNMSQVVTFEGGAYNVLEENDYIHDVDQIGIDAHSGSHNYTIRGNKLEYISIKRDGSVWFNNPSVAIYNDGGNTGVMERNFVNHAGVGFQALSEPGMPATHDVTIRNNIVENSNSSGVVIGTWYSSTDGSSVFNINVWNNTFYANATGVTIRPMVSSSVSWQNNIFANNGTTYANQLNWNPGTAAYNVYFGGGNGPGSNNLTLDPLFVGASTGNFSLQSTSPAMNAGDPNSSTSIVGTVDFAGNQRIQGGKIAIGAYEQ